MYNNNNNNNNNKSRAGTHPSCQSFLLTLTGNQNVLIPKFNIFWIPAKVEGITDKRDTSADYY